MTDQGKTQAKLVKPAQKAKRILQTYAITKPAKLMLSKDATERLWNLIALPDPHLKTGVIHVLHQVALNHWLARVSLIGPKSASTTAAHHYGAISEHAHALLAELGALKLLFQESLGQRFAKEQLSHKFPTVSLLGFQAILGSLERAALTFSGQGKGGNKLDLTLISTIGQILYLLREICEPVAKELRATSSTRPIFTAAIQAKIIQAVVVDLEPDNANAFTEQYIRTNMLRVMRSSDDLAAYAMVYELPPPFALSVHK